MEKLMLLDMITLRKFIKNLYKNHGKKIKFLAAFLGIFLASMPLEISFTCTILLYLLLTKLSQVMAHLHNLT